jgi:ABC-2 type transport system ATP-binding protein
MVTQLAVEVHDLGKRYERAGVQALDSISFDIASGEIFAYLGRNGAGKSTTVRILTTLLRPTAGRALVGGFDVCTEPAAVRRVIGAAMQSAALDDLMTGREQLALAARLAGLGKAESRDRTHELLGAFGLTDAGDRIAARYSGGMRRRLDVAMAVIRRPEVLFLDEPTSGLDPQGRRALWALVRGLRDLGSTVFLTTQNLSEAEELAVRLAIVHAGTIVAVGSPTELKARFGGAATIRMRVDPDDVPRVRQVTEDCAHSQSTDGWLTLEANGGEAAIPAVISRLETAGVSIEGLSVRGPSLEDVFVNLTGSEIESSAHSGDSGALVVTKRNLGQSPRIR